MTYNMANDTRTSEQKRHDAAHAMADQLRTLTDDAQTLLDVWDDDAQAVRGGTKMTRPIRTATERDVRQVRTAVRYARDAQHMLRLAGATKAARYMARAIKSAEGAERHAQRALMLRHGFNVARNI